jgi:hypothetical protein
MKKPLEIIKNNKKLEKEFEIIQVERKKIVSNGYLPKGFRCGSCLCPIKNNLNLGEIEASRVWKKMNEEEKQELFCPRCEKF